MAEKRRCARWGGAKTPPCALRAHTAPNLCHPIAHSAESVPPAGFKRHENPAMCALFEWRGTVLNTRVGINAPFWRMAGERIRHCQREWPCHDEGARRGDGNQPADRLRHAERDGCPRLAFLAWAQRTRPIAALRDSVAWQYLAVFGSIWQKPTSPSPLSTFHGAAHDRTYE